MHVVKTMVHPCQDLWNVNNNLMKYLKKIEYPMKNELPRLSDFFIEREVQFFMRPDAFRSYPYVKDPYSWWREGCFDRRMTGCRALPAQRSRTLQIMCYRKLRGPCGIRLITLHPYKLCVLLEAPIDSCF